MNDDLLRIEAGLVGNGAAGVLWCAGQTEGLGEMEGGVQADLADLVRVDLFRGRTGRQRWEC